MALRINAVNPVVFGAFRAGNRQGPQGPVWAECERRFIAISSAAHVISRI